MVVNADDVDREDLVARLAATDDAAARARLLEIAVDPRTARDLAERLKEEADRARYQDHGLALRWSDDIIALGRLATAPTVVALGHMVAALVIYDQGQYAASLARFDQAGALFRAHGDEVGWARTQIGRIGPCRVLGRFDEALERAYQAREILERAGAHLHVAGIDANLAMLLERMNRLAEALDSNQRALAVYRANGSTYYALHLLRNYALLLWRLGRVREALEAHVEARQGYLELGAATDAAREDLNIGAVYLALGHYADAVSVLLGARKAFLAAELPDSAALAGLFLAECYYQLGRYRDVIAITPALRDEFTLCGITVEHVQALVWEALAQAGLGAYDAALRALDAAIALLTPHDHLASYRAAVDVERAGLLLEWGRLSEARALLEAAIPPLREAGLAMKVAMAQVLLGRALIEEGRPADAHAVAGAALTMAQREGLDWLTVRALHLRGIVAMRSGRHEHARADLTGAMRHLDRVHRRVTWDDRATFSGTAAAIYADAVGLALGQGQPDVALGYAERAKARALAEHLRGHVDIRPRAHDERSRALVDELAALRDRYAWLNAMPGAPAAERPAPAAAVRWAAGPALDAATRDEAARVEGRMAAIWRELQANNPAYRGEAAAIDLAAGDDDDPADDGEAMQRWIQRLHAVLGTDGRVALLEYTAQGDALVLFVVRAGRAQAVRLSVTQTEVRQLVALLRLNVESSAGAMARGGGTMRALAGNARGLLRRLHAALLAPAWSLLDGAERLVIVPHGATHHVPFHALYDGGSYLLESCEVGYAPCASLLEHFDERQRQLHLAGASAGEALVVCCSAGGALPHVVPEGQAVVAALGGRLLCEEEATLPALRALGSSAAVIHLAAHAVFRPDEPLFSSLQLCDGRLTTLDMFDLELHCSLVTLSACETSLGTAGAGDELMGLSRALLYAGAPSLILSLWKVEDRSTAVLMERLYRALRRGERKGAALRQAQLALLHGEGDGTGDLSAPFFWAPFQIIGHTGTL